MYFYLLLAKQTLAYEKIVNSKNIYQKIKIGDFFLPKNS